MEIGVMVNKVRVSTLSGIRLVKDKRLFIGCESLISAQMASSVSTLRRHIRIFTTLKRLSVILTSILTLPIENHKHLQRQLCSTLSRPSSETKLHAAK